MADGYALDGDQRAELCALLGPRIWSMYRLLKDGHRYSIEPWGRLWSEGHGAAWRADGEYVQKHHPTLLAAVLDGR
jgi:hypothetical protein